MSDTTGGVGDTDEFRKQVRRALDEHFERLEAHDAMLKAGELQMTALETRIDHNTQLTEQATARIAAVKEDTGEIVEWLKAWEGFRAVMKMLGTAVKWAAGLILSLAVLWWVVKTGTLPPPK